MWYVALYSFIAGVGGTFLGGVLGALVPKKHLGVFNSVASGIMLALVCLELIPDTFKVSGLLLLVLGVAAGVLAMEVLRLALDKGRKGVRIKTGGILMFFAIALHNFPEGLAIGGSEALASGIPIAILIALHDIPEGLVVAAPLIESGVKRWKAALYAAVSGLPTVLGAVIGLALSDVFDVWVALSLSMASGAMLYMVFCELEMQQPLDKRSLGYFEILGFIIGLIMINVL